MIGSSCEYESDDDCVESNQDVVQQDFFEDEEVIDSRDCIYTIYK